MLILLTPTLARLYSFRERMSTTFQPPTPYPQINNLLYLLLSNVRRALRDQFVGLYLYGSLSGGDFDETTSDVDFVVVTRDEITGEHVPRLRAMHAEIAASGLKWAPKLEGSYISRAALLRYNPDDAPRPQYNEGEFFVAPHGSDWIIQRHILREQGVVIAGPPLKPLIEPVTPGELRRAVVDVLQGWWQTHILAQPSALKRPGYQPYAVLTMCRSLYALEQGEIVSKPAAARWAIESLGAEWTPLIERALAGRADLSGSSLHKTMALIRFTLERARAWEMVKAK